MVEAKDLIDLGYEDNKSLVYSFGNLTRDKDILDNLSNIMPNNVPKGFKERGCYIIWSRRFGGIERRKDLNNLRLGWNSKEAIIFGH